MSYQDYSDQANNNQASFLSDLQYKERKDVFITLAKAFTNAGVNWTVGCSLSLFFRGIVDDFHDIDLIVSLRDIDIIDEIMELKPLLINGSGSPVFGNINVATQIFANT